MVSRQQATGQQLEGVEDLPCEAVVVVTAIHALLG